MVIRTDHRLDGMVSHLGYRSVDAPPAGSGKIPTDRGLVRASQERLSQATAIPPDRLHSKKRANLQLAQTLAAKVFPARISASKIPPASDRVQTAGLYNLSTGDIYIHVDVLPRARDTIDTLVHELAHHRQYSLTGETADLVPSHAESMTYVAGKVVELVDSGKLDSDLKGIRW